jgi:hypothetical protein
VNQKKVKERKRIEEGDSYYVAVQPKS